MFLRARILVSFCEICLVCVIAFAQASPPAPPLTAPVLHAADLQSDVAVLREAYQTMHPGLYRYNSKPQMDAAFQDLAQQLNHDQSREQAFIAFSTFSAKIRCGHTYANPLNQSKAVAEALFTKSGRVPFYFEWIGSRMVVTRDFTAEHDLKAGDEILEIDGRPVSLILSRLMTVARADGSNDAKRVASLGVRGDSIYETFDIFFPMFFPLSPGTMKLLVRGPGESRPRRLEVEALTYAQRIGPIKSREDERRGGNEAVFEWKCLPDGAAYLRMETWSLYNSKWDWKAWLNTHLDDLADKQSPALIVDLRGNEGGIDVGNLILSRIVKNDLKSPQSRRLVRYRRAAADLTPYLDTWDPSFKDWGAAAAPLPEPWPTAPAVNYYRLTRYDDDADGDVMKAQGKPYRGKVFVLVDANNSSATFQFAQIVQQNQLGLLVGQPTGGNQRGINGGAFFFLRLPHSGIEMDLPLIGYFPATEKPDAGLTPDIVVMPTIDDIARGADPVMAALVAAIEKPR